VTSKEYDEMVLRVFQGTVNHPLLVAMLTEKAQKGARRLAKDIRRWDREAEQGLISREEWTRHHRQVLRILERIDSDELDGIREGLRKRIRYGEGR
jgi:hypothetical protein